MTGAGCRLLPGASAGGQNAWLGTASLHSPAAWCQHAASGLPFMRPAALLKCPSPIPSAAPCVHRTATLVLCRSIPFSVLVPWIPNE